MLFKEKIGKGEIIMARCPYLEYDSDRGGFFGECEYHCRECGKHFYASDSQLKYTCDAEYGEEYKKCSVYQNS